MGETRSRRIGALERSIARAEFAAGYRWRDPCRRRMAREIGEMNTEVRSVGPRGEGLWISRPTIPARVVHHPKYRETVPDFTGVLTEQCLRG